MDCKIRFDDIFIYFSIIVFILIMNFRSYISNLFNSSYVPFLLYIVGLFSLFFVIVKRKIKLNKNNKFYIFLVLLMLLPSFYKNAYLIDNKNVIGYLYYVFTIFYSILICLCCSNKKYVSFLLKGFVLFAIITSIVTWISFFFPDFYLSKIVTLLPFEERKLVMLLLNNSNAYSGLTNHYSRNAFFVILGVISIIYKLIKDKNNTIKSKKINFILLFFFSITLFLIGKRGHILFLIASLVITCFVYNKITLKNIIRFLIIIFISSIILLISIKYIPGVSNTINRVFNTGVENDFSTGRFELYEKAFTLFKNNNAPIGWGGFVKSTNYTYAGVHNDYIQIFIETGIVGFVFIIGSNLLILKRIISKLSIKKNALVFIVLLYNVFFMLYSLTGIPHYDLEVYMTYFIFNSFYFSNMMFLDFGDDK